MNHSSNFAGYTAVDSQPITAFSGTLDVPTVTCPSTGATELEAEIALTSSTSSQRVGFGWFIFCTGGTANYSNSYASVTGGGHHASGQTGIAPGDELHFSMVDSTTMGNVTATVKNRTQGTSGSGTVTMTPNLTGVLAGITNGTSGAVTPIPSFTSVRYGALKFNGAILSSLSPTRYGMYNGATLQIWATTIAPSGGFSALFKHS